MAVVRIQDGSNSSVSDPQSVRSFLAPLGIIYERWDVEARIPAQASADEILAAYAPEIETLKATRGYVTADVVDITPETPNLQAMLDKFNKEHRHAEDEVRFVLKGRGLFYIHPESHEVAVFSIEVEAGDLINVPAGTKHWFDLCSERTIRAIRLFREKAGWTPLYTGDGIAAQFQPLCFGSSYLDNAATLLPRPAGLG